MINEIEKNEENIVSIDESLADETSDEVISEDAKNNEVKTNEKTEEDEMESFKSKICEYQEMLSKKEKECIDYIDLLKRSRAEFDNYRKRTNKEKESMYDSGFSDALKQVFPIVDNLERAMATCGEKESSLFKGIEMTYKLLIDSLEKNGVEEIKAEGEKFNPDFHNAISHIEDEKYEENTIVEVLQKGYKYKENVIRFSMVKVAN